MSLVRSGARLARASTAGRPKLSAVEGSTTSAARRMVAATSLAPRAGRNTTFRATLAASDAPITVSRGPRGPNRRWAEINSASRLWG